MYIHVQLCFCVYLPGQFVVVGIVAWGVVGGDSQVLAAEIAGRACSVVWCGVGFGGGIVVADGVK